MILCSYLCELGALAECVHLCGGGLGGLLLLDAGHSGEGELPDAGECKQDCYKSDCSFTLHNYG